MQKWVLYDGSTMILLLLHKGFILLLTSISEILNMCAWYKDVGSDVCSAALW